jgi:hypothetical protein
VRAHWRCDSRRKRSRVVSSNTQRLLRVRKTTADETPKPHHEAEPGARHARGLDSTNVAQVEEEFGRTRWNFTVSFRPESTSDQKNALPLSQLDDLRVIGRNGSCDCLWFRHEPGN